MLASEETDLRRPVLLMGSLWMALQEGMMLSGFCFTAQWGEPEGGRRGSSPLTGPCKTLTMTQEAHGTLQDPQDGKGA